MITYRYKAMTQDGEVVVGSISAPSATEVGSRIEYLGLIPIETVAENTRVSGPDWSFSLFSRPTKEDVTIFTRDIALLLSAGARINDALDLLSTDFDVGRLRPVIVQLKAAVLSGETFSDALAMHPTLFPPVYIILIRVGENSGTLDQILEALSAERQRADLMRRKLADALRYPAFVLFAAFSVLLFFLFFVLPQFANVLRDLGAKLDPTVAFLLNLSDFARANTTAIVVAAVGVLLAGWATFRQPGARAALISILGRLPLIRSALSYHRATLFCRNLGLLLSSGVTMTATLRVMIDMMTATGSRAWWTNAADRVRHGGKLSDALAEAGTLLPPMAVRMLRLGEETAQLPMLARRVADFYETKLQRSLDRMVAIAGPAAIIFISTIVGGLIVSIMTALLSVSQIVG